MAFHFHEFEKGKIKFNRTKNIFPGHFFPFLFWKGGRTIAIFTFDCTLISSNTLWLDISFGEMMWTRVQHFERNAQNEDETGSTISSTCFSQVRKRSAIPFLYNRILNSKRNRVFKRMKLTWKRMLFLQWKSWLINWDISMQTATLLGSDLFGWWAPTGGWTLPFHNFWRKFFQVKKTKKKAARKGRRTGWRGWSSSFYVVPRVCLPAVTLHLLLREFHSSASRRRFFSPST